MTDYVELKFNGVKCDHCDFNDPTATKEDFKYYVNKPCPKCGENLLTVEDFETVIRMTLIAEQINGYLTEIQFPNNGPRIQTPMSMNGSGKVVIDPTKTRQV